MDRKILIGEDLHKAAMHNKIPFSTDVGVHVFKRYIALLYRLCVVENNQYDLLIGPGDSGAVMVYFAELFYKALGINLPTKLAIPIQRFKTRDKKSGKYDNSTLAPLEKGCVVESLSKILFLDDEICEANSASECAKLVTRDLPEIQKHNRILFTIIADNHGFEWHYDVPPVAIQYYSFSRRNKGKNNAALRILSDEDQAILNGFTEPYLDKEDKADGQTKKMNLLFNGMVKVPTYSGDGMSKPRFKHVSMDKSIFNSVNFLEFRSKIEKNLFTLIRDAIDEYKEGKLIFLF